MQVDPYKNLVLIKWIDSGTHEDKWTSIDAAIESGEEDLEIVTVGILLKKTDTHYILARSCDLQTPQAVDGVFQIPIDVVKEVYTLSINQRKKR